jgi:tripartite-type tricarboxylate transporter receptor subunit TctC
LAVVSARTAKAATSRHHAMRFNRPLRHGTTASYVAGALAAKWYRATSPLRSGAAMIRHVARAVFALVLAAPFAAFAQAYPNRPLKLIVPDGPGSAPDIRARQLTAKLQQLIGQPVVVDNRPGGSMIIGAEAAARSAPDGYTLFMGNSTTHALNPALFKSLPYKDEDFIPITLVSAGPLILVVNPASPVTTVKELVALAKSRPASLSYGVIGYGSSSQLVMAQLSATTGARFEPVAYKGTGQYVQDLVGGHLDFGLNFWSVLGGSVRGGRLRAIAVASPRRLEAAPEIPTFAEAGFEGIEALAWQGIFVPAGTPREIVARLQADVVRAVRAPEVSGPIVEQGAEAGGNAPEEFAAFVRAERARWKKAATEARIELQ